MELTPEQVASEDAGYWAVLNMIKLQASVFSFKDHEYQIEPMSSTARRRCYMKATQGGFTEIEVLRSLWAMIKKHHPLGDLYMFPNADVVREFSQSRFAPLLLANKQAIGRYVKSGGKGTDTVSLKKIHDAFLYLRGARLSMKISDQAESAQMSSIPVDAIKFDELDKMDEYMEVVAKARGRFGHSKIKEEVYLSNPLVPGAGIDNLFSKSDQRHWFRKCSHCNGTISTSVATTSLNRRTCAELFFLEDPERCVGTRADGTGYIACKKCGRELSIDRKENGKLTSEWVPSVPTNSGYMHGYRWSHLTSSFNDPLDILHDFRDPPEGNLADVYRLRLGLPYIAAEDRLTQAQVYECCNNDEMYSSHSGPCAMGVDVGIKKHIIIGARTGNKQYTIFKTIVLSEWKDIHDLARKFHVKSAVIDIRPYQDSAKKFQEDEPYQVFLCEYSNNPAYTRTWDIKRGIVKDYRTALFDETHRMVVTPGMLTIPRICPEIKEFAKQMCDAYKLLETNKRTSAREYRYKGDNEHYRNALNYFLLAASRSRVQRAGNRNLNAEKVISEYSRI